MTNTPWIVDPGALINLAAVMPLAEVSTRFRRPIVAARQAVTEDLSLHEVVDGDRRRRPVPVDGLVVEDLADGELEVFVRLSAHLADGEAATLAIAHGRSYSAVSDDPVTRRNARSLEPAVQVVGTLTVVKQYAQTNRLATGEVRRTREALEHRARFRPRVDDPEYSWWISAGDQAADYR